MQTGYIGEINKDINLVLVVFNINIFMCVKHMLVITVSAGIQNLQYLNKEQSRTTHPYIKKETEMCKRRRESLEITYPIKASHLEKTFGILKAKENKSQDKQNKKLEMLK